MAPDREKSLVTRLAEVDPQSDLDSTGEEIRAETIHNPNLRAARLRRWMNQLGEAHLDRRDSLQAEMASGTQQLFLGIEANNRVVEQKILDNILAQNPTLEEANEMLLYVSHHKLAEIFKLYCHLTGQKTGQERNNAIRVGKATIDTRVHMNLQAAARFQAALDSLSENGQKRNRN